METLESLKEQLEPKLDGACTSLRYQNAVMPYLFLFKKEGIVEVRVTLDDENLETERSCILGLCKDDDVHAAALLFDSFVKTGPLNQVKALEGQDLQFVEGHVECIMVFLYTREGTWCKTVQYQKLGDQDYWFGDGGWEVVPKAEGQFANPFLK